MGLREMFGRDGAASSNGLAISDAPQQTLSEVLETHDVVTAEEGYLVVQARKFDTQTRPDFRELGGSGSTSWGSWSTNDYNPDLAGQLGLRKFDEMRRSDGLVSSALMLRKVPVLAARWYIEPASANKRDQKIAKEIWKNLTTQMSMSWPRFLSEALAYLDFGIYPFEKVLERADGKIRWRKFAPRHPLDISEIDYDRHGGPDGIWFNTAPATPASGKIIPFPTASGQIRPGEVYIPIQKLLVFTHLQEGGNLMGRSLARPMYKHHFITDVLYKIDAIQKERHGIGIPIIKLPPQANTDDKLKADQMGRNLRTNEKAHVVLPAMWEIATLKLEGNLVNPIESAKHHNSMVLSSVLAQFMETGAQGAGLETLVDLFMKASRNDAEVVRDTLNKWAISDIVRYNYGTNVDPPTLEVRRIGETADARTLSFSLRNLVGSQLLQPDKPLIEAVRKEYDLPAADPATAIQPPTPQAPPSPDGARVGPPRQSQAGNMDRTKNPGKSNTGTDKSGGGDR